jgi:hypothetical protein
MPGQYFKDGSQSTEELKAEIRKILEDMREYNEKKHALEDSYKQGGPVRTNWEELYQDDTKAGDDFMIWEP